MKQLIVNSGKLSFEEIIGPINTSKNVKIRVLFASISHGTDTTTIYRSGESLIQKIKRKPKNVLKGFNFIFQNSFVEFNKLLKYNSINEIGYSISGEVVEVGNSVTGFSLGDHVAAVGAGRANIAEEVSVPSSLVFKVSRFCDLFYASFTAQAAIALNGIRVCDIKIGEKICIIGTGLIGLFCTSFAKISGAFVTTLDFDNDRNEIAQIAGSDNSISPNDFSKSFVRFDSDGVGYDTIIVCAGIKDIKIINNFAKEVRNNGKFVLLGDIPFSVDRNLVYKKNLNVLISTSYGPGRYDYSYEDECIDYPFSYVRWTSGRNCKLYLKYLELDKLKWLKSIKPSILKTEDNPEINKSLLTAFDFTNLNSKKDFENNEKSIDTLVISPGNYFFDVHLPTIKNLGIEISGAFSSNIKSQLRLREENIKVLNCEDNYIPKKVIITSRHKNHARLIFNYASNNTSVFIEKPLCINLKELVIVRDFLKSDKNLKHLQVGYSRTFSKYSDIIKHEVKNKTLILNYTFITNFKDQNDWTNQDGGRIIGEMCHLVDWALWLCDSEIKSISYNKIGNEIINQDCLIVITFENGTVANLHYQTHIKELNWKEKIEVISDGVVFNIFDFKLLLKNNKVVKKGFNKGYQEQLQYFFDNSANNLNEILIDRYILTSEITIKAANC